MIDKEQGASDEDLAYLFLRKGTALYFLTLGRCCRCDLRQRQEKQ